MCNCKRRTLWTVVVLIRSPWLLFNKNCAFLCFNKIAWIHVFIFSNAVDIYFRNTLFVCKFYFYNATDLTRVFGITVILFSLKKMYVNRQTFLHRRSGFLLAGLPWKLLHLLPSKHPQREHVLSCAMCGLFGVCALTASTKTCTSLRVWPQGRDKPCHLPRCRHEPLCHCVL